MKKHILFLITTLLVLALHATAGAIPIIDRDDWSGTYFRGNKLGFNHARVQVGSDEIKVNTQMYFRLKAGGAAQVTTMSQDTRLSPDLKLKGFTLLQEIMGNRQKIEARVVGDELKLDVATSGYRKEKTLPYTPDMVPASTVWLNMMRKGLNVGDKGRYQLFVEAFQTVTPMDYEVLRREKVNLRGKEEDTLVILQKYSGMRTTLWVTDDGTILRELSAQGFESRYESEKVARSMGDGGTMSVSSFITLSLVKTEKPITDPYDRATLKVIMKNVKGPDSIPQDHRQKVLMTKKSGADSFATTLLVRREAKSLARPASFPLGKNLGKEFLDDTSQIQSKHGQIRSLARNLKDGKTDPWQVALTINKWVNSNLEKALVDAFTAVDALRSRKGECQSHTNLFVAIARAAGIPAKVVNGLVYSDKYQGFMYHAWPEVYVGEWRALDPTLGQDVVDATHIKLSEGNFGGSLKLMEFIGQVDIELLEN